MRTLEEVIKNKPKGSKVGVQFLVTKYNENEINEMKSILKKINVDFFNLKSLSLDIASTEKADIKKIEDAKTFLPLNKKYSRYKI